MWNFRRGVDWATDPTGNTLLPNTVLVDGLEGNDANDGLSRANPLKTLTQAKVLYANTYTIVCAPWRYVDQIGTIGGIGETYKIIGDSLDDDVVFIDSQNALTGLSNEAEGIVLVGFLNTTRTDAYTVKMVNCVISDCVTCYVGLFYGCRIINTALVTRQVNGTGPTLASCALLNSSYAPNHSTNTAYIRGCYIDGASTINFVSGTIQMTNNHIVLPASWSAVATIFTGNTDGDAYINDAALLNYTFDPVLSPLFGRGYPDGFVNPRNMAKYYIGIPFYSGISSFDAKIAANANLSVVSNELLNTGPNNIEFLETDEVVLSSLQALGLPHKVGLITYLSTLFGLNPLANSLDRVLEIRYTDTLGGVFGAYKQYRFGEQATMNTGGVSNGDNAYNWNENNPIFVREFQVRIGIVKGGVVS